MSTEKNYSLPPPLRSEWRLFTPRCAGGNAIDLSADNYGMLAFKRCGGERDVFLVVCDAADLRALIAAATHTLQIRMELAAKKRGKKAKEPKQ